MGMHEREWYRVGGGGRPPFRLKVVHVLVAANVAVFLLQMVALRAWNWSAAAEGFGLYPRDVVGRLHVWQIVTSMFLHATPLHLFFNMFVLWMFGQQVEAHLGRWPFVRFYFGAGIAAGIAYVVLGLLTNSTAGAVGASGAIMGVLVYFTCLRPNATVYLFFMVPMKMVVATALIVGLDLFFFVFGTSGSTGIAHTAHLGGALYGYLYYRFAPRVARVFKDRSTRRRGQTAARREESLGEMQTEVDRLLDRISAHGLDSLSEKDKRFLREASERLKHRR